ncbi:MAG: hypothetical protein HYU66_27725 [Armatimonadetes bacterium]|nr:hypothetical protein [Armatimonadota bacterium]
MLNRVDLTLALDKPTYEEQLRKYQLRLRELEFDMYEHRIPAMVVYEGWDAGGKGGNIKRLTETLDPRGYSVNAYAAPQGEEREHQYLWRFWRCIPKAGHLAVFDRSWYGRVMVERIEGFCTTEEWQRAFEEINEFERHLTSFGLVLCKFWIHISKEEQLRRFEERSTIAYKRYKLTEEDWRNREKWDQYQEAVEEMLVRTSTLNAPWTVVEGNNKYWARVKTIRTLCEALEHAVERQPKRRKRRS